MGLLFSKCIPLAILLRLNLQDCTCPLKLAICRFKQSLSESWTVKLKCAYQQCFSQSKRIKQVKSLSKMDRFANKKYFFARLTNGTASENGHATSGETNERLIQLENQNEALRRCLHYRIDYTQYNGVILHHNRITERHNYLNYMIRLSLTCNELSCYNA